MGKTHSILPRHPTEHTLRKAYSHVARFYDFWSRLTESKAAAYCLKEAAISDGERVLEVAVGTGTVFAELLRRNPHGHTEGVDLSPDMLAIAKQKVRNVPPEQYHLQIASAFQLPFDANTFDLLINNFMLELFAESDFAIILAEFRRVLKPDGRLVISTMSYGEKWYNKIWPLIARYMPSLLTGCRPAALAPFVTAAGFGTVHSILVSQMTFPTEVLSTRKIEPQAAPPTR